MRAGLVGLFAVGLYLLFRFFVEALGNARGLESTGLLSADSYYHFSFAKELARTNSWIWFSNPFGTLDAEPSLFSLLASILRVFAPIYKNNLFIFDVCLASFSIYWSSVFACRVFNISNYFQAILLLLGTGGLGLLSVIRLLAPSDFMSIVFWGPGGALNWISTPEILYHALFFMGAAYRKAWLGWKLRAFHSLLFLLHPFTGVIFSVYLLNAAFFDLYGEPLREAKLSFARDYFRRVADILFASAFWVLLLTKVWPRFSNDAAFFLQIYNAVNEHFSLKAYLSIYVLAVGLLLVIFISRRGRLTTTSPLAWSWLSFGLMIGIIPLLSLLGIPIVQPLHWIRVYPYIFIMAGLHAFVLEKVRVTRFFGFISLLDVFAGLFLAAMALLVVGSPPQQVTPSQAQLVEALKSSPPMASVIVRSCKQYGELGRLEYLLTAVTSLRFSVSHSYFSPDAGIVQEKMIKCSSTTQSYPPPAVLAESGSFNESGSLVIYDMTMLRIEDLEMPPKGKEIFRNEHFMVWRR